MVLNHSKGENVPHPLPPPNEAVTLENLYTLHLELDGPLALRILDTLILPNLLSLVITLSSCDAPIDASDIEVVTAFLIRSRCQLREFAGVQEFRVTCNST